MKLFISDKKLSGGPSVFKNKLISFKYFLINAFFF